MQNPRIIETVASGATYRVPTFKVTNDGLVDGDGAEIHLCKGNKADESVFRQEGFFTETLLQVCKQYLVDVNVGDLATEDTKIAIQKIDEALMWIGKRATDRQLRGVQATYQK